jgi:hypothetical protein
MEKKKKRFYPKDSAIRQIFDIFYDRKVSIFIKFPKSEMVQVNKSALFDLIFALRADNREKIDLYLETVKKKLREEREGGESDRI